MQWKSNLSQDNSGVPPVGPIHPAVSQSAESAVPLEWEVGDDILDTYQVMEKYTSGGMGRVYKVHHKGWKIDLAVKSPKQEMVEKAGGAQGFVQESETWVNLGLHPHIVSCYYVRVLGGIPRVFAEYVSGGSLREWIGDGRLYAGGREKALERMLDIAIMFAWGLEYAHEQGLVHQDVKPDNAMLTPDGLLKVTDFGLAKGKSTGEDRFISPGGRGEKQGGTMFVSYGGALTKEYASPEQADAQAEVQAGIPKGQRTPITRKSDVWSWGVSILEMFMGERPGDYGQFADVYLEQYLQDDHRGKDIPPMPGDIAGLLRMCFEREPGKRPAMKEVGELLQLIYWSELGHDYGRVKPAAVELRADSLNNKALSLLDLGREEDARRAWELALEGDPQHLESTYNLGLMQWRKAEITDADLLLKLRGVGESRKGDWLPAYLKAQVHLERGDCEGILKELEDVEEQSHPGIGRLKNLAQEHLPNSRRCVRTFEGHNLDVTSVCLSADGRLALSGSADKTMRLWDLESGQCLRIFEGHTNYVNSVCQSANGCLALSGSDDQTMRLWEVETGKCLYSLEGHDKVNSVSLSVNEGHALSGKSKGTLELISWETLNSLHIRPFIGHTTNVNSVCLSADGELALSGSDDGTLMLWNVRTGERLRTFEGHDNPVNSVCFSSEGNHALSGSGFPLPGWDNGDGIRLWEISTGKCLRIFGGQTDCVESVCLSSDMLLALSGSSDNTLRLWEVPTGRCLRTLEGHTDEVHSVSLSADECFAISGSDDHTIRLWGICCDVISSAEYQLSIPRGSQTELLSQKIFEREKDAANQAFLSNEILLTKDHLQNAREIPGLKNADECILLWQRLYMCLPRVSPVNGWLKNTFTGHSNCVTSVCMSEDGQLALSGSNDRTLRLWDVETGQCLWIYEGGTAVNSVSLSADASLALSHWMDGTLRLLEVATGKCLRTFKGHLRLIEPVCLSSDGNFALSGSMGNAIKLWDVEKGDCLRIFEGHANEVDSVWLGTDGCLALSGSWDNTMKLWSIVTGKCLYTFVGHTGSVRSVCLSKDSSYAISGSGDTTIRQWDVTTGKCLRMFQGHTHQVLTVSLSADGKYILSGSEDKTLKLWEVDTGKCLRTFEGHKQLVYSVSLSADGRFALSGSWDGTLRLWGLDWSLEDKELADWDEGARPYLENFLTLRGREDIVSDKWKTPTWNGDDVKHLLCTLGYAGYGWLRPDGVRRKLDEMAASWKGPRPLV